MESELTSNNIVVIGSLEDIYTHNIVNGLCKAGHVPRKVYLGSKAEIFLFKWNSLCRIVRQLGYSEVLKRLYRKRSNITAVLKRSGLSDLAEQYAFEIIYYDHVNQGSVVADIFSMKNCISVLSGCGIVDKAVIEASRGGCINGHPAYLPGLRGVDVIEWAIYNDAVFGVTAHLVDEKIDAGKIIRRKQLSPEKGEKFIDFCHRVEVEQAETLVVACQDIISGDAEFIENNILESKFCYAMPDRIRGIVRKKYMRLTEAIWNKK